MSAENRAAVKASSGTVARAFLPRLVAMMAARGDCPVQTLDDALLAVDALLADVGEHTVNGHVEVEVITRDGIMRIEVGPLRAEGASGLLASAELPGVGNVVAKTARSVTIDETAGGCEMLVLELGGTT